MASVIMLIVLLGLWYTSQQIQLATGRGWRIWRNPYTWFSMLWIAQFAFLPLPLLRYEFETSTSTLVYIFLAHVAFIGGTGFALITHRKHRKVVPTDVKARRDWLLAMIAVAIVGQGALIANGIYSSTVDFWSRFTQEGYEAARTAQLYEGEYDTSFLGPLFGPLSAAAALSLPAIGYFAFYRALGQRWTGSWGVESIAIAVLVAMVAFETIIIAGGRSGVVYVIVAFVGPYLLGKELRRLGEGRPRPRWTAGKWAVAGAIGLALFLGSSWYQQFRSNERDPRRVLWTVEAAEPHPAVDELAAQNNYFGYVLVQLGYITSSSNMLDHYMQLRHHPGPFLGRYNFPTLYRNFGRALPGYNPDFWATDRAELFKPLQDRGRLGNVWSSLIRDLIADFGKVGALFALALFGWAVQRVTDAYYRKPDAFRATLLTLLRLVCVWSTLHSLFFIASISWALLFLAVMVVSGLGLSKETPRRARRRLQATRRSRAGLSRGR